MITCRHIPEVDGRLITKFSNPIFILNPLYITTRTKRHRTIIFKKDSTSFA